MTFACRVCFHPVGLFETGLEVTDDLALCPFCLGPGLTSLPRCSDCGEWFINKGQGGRWVGPTELACYDCIDGRENGLTLLADGGEGF